MSKSATGSGPPSMSRQRRLVKVVKTREAPGPSPSMYQWPVKMDDGSLRSIKGYSEKSLKNS